MCIRDRDHGNVAGLQFPLQPPTTFDTINPRHHHIGDDAVSYTHLVIAKWLPTLPDVLLSTQVQYLQLNIQLSLFVLQIRRIDIGDRTVAIPFEESNFGILLHYILYNTIHIICLLYTSLRM